MLASYTGLVSREQINIEGMRPGRRRRRRNTGKESGPLPAKATLGPCPFGPIQRP